MATFRSSNPFRHESERLVANRLADGLAEDAFVIGNYLLPGKYAGGEIDLVAVLPSGIVAVEVKHWFGRVLRMGGCVEFDNGFSPPNPFPGLQYKAKFLRSHLVERRLIDARLPVGSCLVHGPGRLVWPDEVIRNQYVYGVDTAAERIAAGTMLPNKGRQIHLSPSQLAAIADALDEGTCGADAWKVGHFVIDEELAPTPFTRQFVGRCGHVRERDVLLRCWEMDPLADESARARTMRRLEYEAAALARLESRRCRAIPIIYDAFPDPANFNVFWTVQEYGGPLTLAQERTRFAGEPEFRDSVLSQLDEALFALREAGVVHRNLGSDVISVCNGDRILVGGLEYSVFENGSVCRRTVAQPDRVPPEATGGGSASSIGDLYAVGLMVLDLLIPGRGPPEKRLVHLRDRSLRDALYALLERNPADRATDLQQLRRTILEWNV